MRKLTSLPLAALLTLALLVPPALAAVPTLTTPATHGYSAANCPTTTTHDTITLAGVEANQTVQGFISVLYLDPSSPTGRTPVPQSVTFQGTTTNSPRLFNLTGPGTFTFTLNYPPSSQWPTSPAPDGTGTKEIHVDLSFDVYENGQKIATLGPGLDFDVFCVGFPPPPPPPPTGGDPRTIGYWKNHPTWPITTIPFACAGSGDDLSKAQALAILNGAQANDMTKMLAAQLIAAKLNVAAGAGASAAVLQAISQADAFLCTNPIGSNPSGSARQEAERLKNILDAYNNS